MPAMSFRSTVDAAQAVQMLTIEYPRRVRDAIKRGTGHAAYLLQEMMREELNRMIYETPESPYYRRTRTLYRSTYASRPGADHSRDHDAAASGVDLAVEESSAGGVVKMAGNDASVDVGAYANYAYFVHEGYGQGARVPKPFSARPLAAASQLAESEINKALATALSRR